MPRPDRLKRRRRIAIRLLAGLAALAAAGPLAAAEPLRVCADPNNAPFSRADGSGFENAIARIMAEELGRPLEYTWWAQRRGFLRNTLMAGLCDLVIGLPAHRFEMAARTRPYYRSAYVAVTRADRNLAIASLEDPRLQTLRIGVHLIGDDGANPPPAHVLARRGIIGNVVGFPIYGDYREDAPPQRLIEAVASGAVDVALAWGPLAGPVAKASATPLTVTPLEERPDDAPLRFTFEIAMGVRRDDLALRRLVQEAQDRRMGDIQAVLARFGVPTLPFRKSWVETVTAPEQR